MDQDNGNYTIETRNWLNQRFDLYDSTGVYIPNQPAYGFSALAFRLEEYSRMYSVLRVLNRLPFNSLLDLGCADGYGPALISRLFNVDTWGLDLSDRALVRARELFNLSGAATDAHQLPLDDNTVDVSICTEVLEHVVDPQKVISELCRVSRNFVVLSTPRASSDKARNQHFETLDPNEPHAHIHFFTDSEMRNLAGDSAWHIGARSRLFNTLYDRIAWGDNSTHTQRSDYYQFTVESAELGDDHQQTVRQMLLDRYSQSSTWKKRCVTPVSVAALLRADAALAAWNHRLALDHLVVIGVNPSVQWTMNRVTHRKILAQLLGGFAVNPLRK